MIAKDAKKAKDAKSGPYPHEKRVQRYGYLALGAAVVAGLALILRVESPRALGFELPPLAPLAALALGAIALAVAVARRNAIVGVAGAALMLLAIVPAATPAAGFLDYALGLAYGAALLMAGELVHMTARYERAHRAVDEDNVPEEHINTVTDEALRTLFARSALALLAAASAVGIAHLLAAFGPGAWRAATETTAPLGVAVVAMALALAASLYILARGARMPRREPKPQEIAPDVAE